MTSFFQSRRMGLKQIAVVSLILATTAGVVAAVHSDRLHSPETPSVRIGFLSPTWSDSQGMIYPAFLRALEGRNLSVIARFSEGRDERLDALVAELVAEKVDVIVALQPGGALAAKRGAGTIPVVFLSISDPVRIGLVKDLRRPGGNVTGVANTPTDLNPKRLEILKDALPDLKRVAILARSGNPNSQAHLRDNVAAAQRLGLDAHVFNISGPDQFEPAVAAMVDQRMEAILLVQDGVFFFARPRILELAARHGLPLIADGRAYARDGAFLSYGIADYGDLVAEAIARIDLILQGIPAGEIPVDQPMEIGLAVNLTTAERLRVPVSRALLSRANEIYR
jgi:putative tryptophan/tyrosine transport system substrate-binding protein